jgi:hypothetical protein
MPIARPHCVVLAASTALLATCQAPTDDTDYRNHALEISNRFIASEYRDDPSHYRARVHDDGAAWIVSYHLPPGGTGGGPMVQIDKQSGLVVGGFRGGQ